MASSRQLTIGPVGLERVSSGVATTSKSVAAVDLCELLERAFRVEGHTEKIAAAMLGMSPQSFSKAMGQQYVDNPVMKRLGTAENRQPLKRFLALACEAVGMETMDTEPVRVLRDLNRMLKAVGE